MDSCFFHRHLFFCKLFFFLVPMSCHRLLLLLASALLKNAMPQGAFVPSPPPHGQPQTVKSACFLPTAFHFFFFPPLFQVGDLFHRPFFRTTGAASQPCSVNTDHASSLRFPLPPSLFHSSCCPTVFSGSLDPPPMSFYCVESALLVPLFLNPPPLSCPPRRTPFFSFYNPFVLLYYSSEKCFSLRLFKTLFAPPFSRRYSFHPWSGSLLNFCFSGFVLVFVRKFQHFVLLSFPVPFPPSCDSLFAT